MHMTAKELKSALKSVPDDTPVVVRVDGWDAVDREVWEAGHNCRLDENGEMEENGFVINC